MTVKNMHSDLDISLFQVKNWEEILGEEFYMTNPLVRYILLAILLLVLFLRTLSWLQYLYLKRELKKRFTKLVSIFHSGPFCRMWYCHCNYSDKQKALPNMGDAFFVISLFSAPSNRYRRHSGRR